MIFNRCVSGFMPNLTKHLCAVPSVGFSVKNFVCTMKELLGTSGNLTEPRGTSGNLGEPRGSHRGRFPDLLCNTTAFLEVPGRSIIDGPNGSHHASIVHAINSASSNLKSGVTLLL